MAVHRAKDPKRYTWENVTVGDRLGPVEGIVSDFLVKTHAYAVDDYSDWYFHDSPFGGRIGHPTLLANDILRLFKLAYDMTPPHPGGLHGRNEIEFLKPIFLGQKVTIEGSHTDRYQKRGQDYRILEGTVLDENRKVLLRMRATETVGLAVDTPVGKGTSTPKDAISGEVSPGAVLASKAGKDLPLGAVLPSLTKHTTLEQSIVFSGFPYGWVDGGARVLDLNIHTDPTDAQQRGQPDAIVQGLCSAAYLSELCTNFFGASWLTTGRLSTTFIRPVIVRDTIGVQGMVKRTEEDELGRSRVYLDVWCKNQHGELTTVGHASAEVE